MKKFIIRTFVFVMLLSMSAMASETRVRTMGDNNNILLDDANIFLYPSRILDHPNIGVAEYDEYEDDDDVNRFGIHWKLDANSVLGTYFSTWNSDDRIDLFYGTDMNGNKFGVRAYLMQSSRKYEGTDLSEFANNYYDITIGMTEANGQWDVALNFGTGSLTNKDAAGADITEQDGNSKIELRGRYFQVKNPNYTIIHHAAIMTEKVGILTNSTNSVFTNKNMSIDVGCGVNFTPSSHVLAVFDFGVMYQKYTREITGLPDYESKDLTLPYFKLGMDGEVFKWLDLRLGATSYWGNFKREDGSGDTYSQKYPSNETYFGLGFNFGHLHMDFSANMELFTDGPDFISGANENLISSDGTMSLTYDF